LENILYQELLDREKGAVWLGYDNDLKKHVTVKKLKSDVERGSRDRFKEGAQALARLDHPNIVKIYDTKFPDDGDYYIFMEFVSYDENSFKTLVNLLEDNGGTLPPDTVEIIFGQLCEAIAVFYKIKTGVIYGKPTCRSDWSR